MEKGGYVYILSNKSRKVFYLGVTNSLTRRIDEHRMGVGAKFTSKYKCFYLVYFECFYHIEEALERERLMKKWKRAWKIDLIRTSNPHLRDLSDSIDDYT